MADETVMTPVEGTEPPKANPLAKPAASASSSTLKLKPVDRPASPTGLKLPPKPGLSTAGLKLPPKPGLATAGLKLPPKPGLATQPGLKLPPKPGLATQPGLKLPPKPGLATQPGLKLPPKPGLATSGLKLPARPTIRKPGSTLSMPRPTALGAKVASPAAPAAAPVSAPAPAAPVSAPVPEVKPVPAPEVAKDEQPLETLKSMTQNLKSITAPVPQQAILRKTGIVAEEKSEAQKQAAKSTTSRISLSEAMGAAPVKNENAPMKTIRIKRPIDIPGVTATATKPTVTPSAPKSEATVDSQASTVAQEKPAESPVTMTQRKTIKITRPSGMMRPSGKFGIKRPGAVTAAAPKPDAAATPDGGEAAPKAEGDVPEIADIPSMPAESAPAAAADGEKDLPAGISIVSILVQAAACVAMGALAWFLYTDTQILPF